MLTVYVLQTHNHSLKLTASVNCISPEVYRETYCHRQQAKIVLLHYKLKPQFTTKVCMCTAYLEIINQTIITTF